ncbi:MAG: TolC family protein [Desulfobacterales bacterium]|nr:TolC family protein [Desulfobacterales bacterium]
MEIKARRNVWIVGLFFLFWSGALSRASATEAPQGKGLELTLEACAELVLQNNKELASHFLDLQIQREAVQSEKGAFEPEFSALYQKSADKMRYPQEEKTAVLIAPERDEESADYHLGVELQTPLGTRFKVTQRTREYRDRERDPDDQYQSRFSIEVTQPLLKGSGRASRARLLAARKGAEEAGYLYRQRQMETLLQALSTCWDYFGVREKWRIRQKSVGIARQILKDNETRVRLGKVSKSEILEAEAGLSRRKALEERAAQEVEAARNRLRTFLFLSEHLAFEILFEKEEEMTGAASVAESLEEAFARRPAYLAARKKILQEDILLAFAVNQRWPQLDLTGTYGLNGLGDTAEDAWEYAWKESDRSWRVGLSLSVPLFGGVKSESELRTARLKKRKAILEMKRLEVEIYGGIKTAVGEVNSASKELMHHLRARELNALLLKSELARFEAGRSNSRTLLTREEDLITARETELDAKVYAQKAWLRLLFEKGMLLSHYGVDEMGAGL